MPRQLLSSMRNQIEEPERRQSIGAFCANLYVPFLFISFPSEDEPNRQSMTPVAAEGKGKTGGWPLRHGAPFWIQHEQHRLNTKQTGGFKQKAAEGKITHRSSLSFVILRTLFLCSKATLHSVVIVFYFYRSPGGIVVANLVSDNKSSSAGGAAAHLRVEVTSLEFHRRKLHPTETYCGFMHTHPYNLRHTCLPLDCAAQILQDGKNVFFTKISSFASSPGAV